MAKKTYLRNMSFKSRSKAKAYYRKTFGYPLISWLKVFRTPLWFWKE